MRRIGFDAKIAVDDDADADCHAQLYYYSSYLYFHEEY